jgi:hypothetical protein
MDLLLGADVHVLRQGTVDFHVNATVQTMTQKSFDTRSTVRSESRCALRLRYVDFIVSIEAAVEVCCCFTVFSC